MGHWEIDSPYILHLGSEAKKKKYLPKMASGECIGAIAMTEPGAGSDLQGMKTSATPDGAGFVLHGSKTFITNGLHAGVVVLAAKTEPKTGSKGPTRTEEHTCELQSQMPTSNPHFSLDKNTKIT